MQCCYALATRRKIVQTFQITENEKYGKIQNCYNFIKLEIISQ